MLFLLALLGTTLLANGASAQVDAAGEVEIGVEFFGVGNATRAGDWTGIRILLKDLGDEVRDVAIRLHQLDPDGDTTLHQREVILTPGVSLGAWLYAVMPWSLSPSDAITITVHEADMSGDHPIVGRQIGYERISPKRVVAPDQAMIGVVGRETFGLLQYEERGRSQSEDSITGHELTRIVHSIAVEDLPTEWMGLAPFETIVWTEGDPNLLATGSSAQAITEWVMRGGHLIVVMEPVGDGWFTNTNPLRELLPDVRVTRHEEADLEPYRGLLSRPHEEFKDVPMPTSTVLNTFSPNDDAEAHADPINA